MSETSPEELELEFQEKELKKKEKVANGTPSSNTSILTISQEDSLKNPKSQHDLDYLNYLNLFTPLNQLFLLCRILSINSVIIFK